MSEQDDIDRICAKLREVHAGLNVEVPELLEAVEALQEIRNAAADIGALDHTADMLDTLKKSDQPIRYMKHRMDIREGINVYHPLNKAENGVAIYIHDCLYLHLSYKLDRRRADKKQDPSWMFDWEWRPNTELMRQKFRVNAISHTGRKLLYKPGYFYWKNRKLTEAHEAGKVADDGVLQRD